MADQYGDDDLMVIDDESVLEDNGGKEGKKDSPKKNIPSSPLKKDDKSNDGTTNVPW